jgi:hypothetical protein
MRTAFLLFLAISLNAQASDDTPESFVGSSAGHGPHYAWDGDLCAEVTPNGDIVRYMPSEWFCR